MNFDGVEISITGCVAEKVRPPNVMCFSFFSFFFSFFLFFL